MSAAKPLPVAPEVEESPRSAEQLVDLDAVPYYQRRSRRKRAVRAKTISVKRITKRELWLGNALYPKEEHDFDDRPQTRAECEEGVRPCPFVSCKHNLYLDVSPRTGAIKLNFPDLEPHQMNESCALDVAAKQGVTLEGVAEVMNMTRERVRQIEVKGLAKGRLAIDRLGLHALAEEGASRTGDGKRRLPVLQASDDEKSDDRDMSGDEDADTWTDLDASEFAGETLDE